MPQATQSKQKVPVRHMLTSNLEFTISGAMLPDGVEKGVTLPDGVGSLTLFPLDNFAELLPGEESALLLRLCQELLPDDWSNQIDHVRLERKRSGTYIRVQLQAEASCVTRGRVDAALRSCGFEPVFKL
jgi:hypothetical protein